MGRNLPVARLALPRMARASGACGYRRGLAFKGGRRRQHLVQARRDPGRSAKHPFSDGPRRRLRPRARIGTGPARNARKHARPGFDAQMDADEKRDRVGLDLANAAAWHGLRRFHVGDAAVQQHVAELVRQRGDCLRLRHLRGDADETVPPGGEALPFRAVGAPHRETGPLSQMYEHCPGRLKVWRSARPRPAAASRLVRGLQPSRPVLTSS